MERAFVYGDLLFETMAIVQGRIRYAEDHAARLKAGLHYLDLHTPMDVHLLESLVLPHVAQEQHARVRLVVWRKADGFYRTVSQEVLFEVEVYPLPQEQKSVQEIGLYTGDWKPTSPLSNFKTGNALVYIQALKYADIQGWNDVLISNQAGHICEASSSNLFWVKEQKIYTAPLSEGCVMGVMRSVLLRQLPANDFEIEEKPVRKNELLQADELFLTNAIHRIQSVETFEGKQYQHAVADKIRNLLN